ncbi:MAG: NAD-dependent dihydropyrimidine dehydrogenase subunit PreA [Acidobacteria bacterium]|nr:NAD-dependent dihydropyrimidine dehydrogenase subunit PreA [Acidobacteriota bacterium]
MADLSVNFAGIKSPNPFWLASAPPTNMGSMIERAFDAGWGGAVWKTLGEPIVNVSSRLAAIDYGSTRMLGLNNIELITDRPLEVNLREMYECKKKYPNHAVIASLMVESKREAWHEIVKRTQDTGCDGFELNFGCPHGMSERGMGAAMGQVPEYTCMVTEWVKEVSALPVIVKLTPNVTNIVPPGRAAQKGGADAVSLINTINSVMGVDLDTMIPHPNVNGMAAHGGYCGPAVKPIALNMVSELARDAEFSIPISGIGGISTWRDAVEFILLGAGTVQVCTAVMHYGYRIVEDMIDGLNSYLDDKGFASVNDIVGRSVDRVTDWGNLDLNYKVVARVNNEHCVKCNLCYIACEDGAHQCFSFDDNKFPVVDEHECVGCNLCTLVCPAPGAVTMVRLDDGSNPQSWKQRIG